MKERELITLLGESVAGRLRIDRSGKLSFAYDDRWRKGRGSYPISLSMPLLQTVHEDRIVQAFLWGLLPDSAQILDSWGKKFQVSPRNPFALLSQVGEDCPGAVRIVRPERVAELAERSGRIEWLGRADIGDRLRELRHDASAWRAPDDAGQFSLAGAQPKTAFYKDRDRWGVPSGTIPTTHILKPGVPGFEAQAQNEHFCLELAHNLGIPTAFSWVESFDGEVAIVVKRYDRTDLRDGAVRRVHQEDMCQALGVHPINKYEMQGGPGARAIVELLREHSRRPDVDVERFVDALAFNWLIAGSDAHAKNYSVLIGAGGDARFAPLYDVASILPYPNKYNPRKLKLAMKVGGKYRLHDIGRHAWSKLAADLGLDSEAMIARHMELAEKAPDAANEVLRKTKGDGLAEPLLERLADAIASRANELVKSLGAGSAPTSRARMTSLKAKLAESALTQDRERLRSQLEVLRDGFRAAAAIVSAELDAYDVDAGIHDVPLLPDGQIANAWLRFNHKTISSYHAMFIFQTQSTPSELVVNAENQGHGSRTLLRLPRSETPSSEETVEAVVSYLVEELEQLIDASSDADSSG